MTIHTKPQSGFTLVEIMIVVAIIGLLAAIAVPNFVKARTTAQTKACISNLGTIRGAIQQWALEEKKGRTSAVTIAELSGGVDKHVVKEINNGLDCPASGTYAVVDVATNPTCTIADHTL